MLFSYTENKILKSSIWYSWVWNQKPCKFMVLQGQCWSKNMNPTPCLASHYPCSKWGKAYKWATAWQSQQNCLCAQQRLGSAWAWPSLIRVSTMHFMGSWRTQGFFRQTLKTDQTGRMPRLIWVLADWTGHLVGFVMQRLTLLVS